MRHISPEEYINDARSHQQHGGYDLAIDSLKMAQQADLRHRFTIEIQKLFCFNYRKLGDFDMALFCINSAINYAKKSLKRLENQQMQKEYAICLMNKGIVYEERNELDKAVECYLPALQIFMQLYNSDPENYGMIINALLTIGLFYYNGKQYSKAREYLENAIPYFGAGKESDRRYLSIINTLSELNNNNGGEL